MTPNGWLSDVQTNVCDNLCILRSEIGATPCRPIGPHCTYTHTLKYNTVGCEFDSPDLWILTFDKSYMYMRFTLCSKHPTTHTIRMQQ